MPPAERGSLAGPSRALPRALVALAAVLLVARIGLGVWEARNAPKSEELVTWVGIAQAEAEAKRTGHPILYAFGAEGQGAWAQLSRDVFADPRAAQLIARTFVPVRVLDRRRQEGRNPPEVDQLQRAYGVTGYPTLVVAWPGSPRFESVSGYRGRDETMKWMTQSAALTHMRSMGILPDSAVVPR